MNKLQRFFTDNWTVQSRDLENVVALLMPSILSGNLAAASAELEKSTSIRLEVRSPYTACRYEFDDVTLPDNSVAVIKMKGLLYSWDTESLFGILDTIEANNKLCGVVFVIDGPGGMASYVDRLALKIQNFSKPTATVVVGTMASAHFWIGTAAGRTFIADSPLCEVGSVGVVVSYYSFRKFLEQNGIKYYEIYPDTSDLKNRPIRDLEEREDDSLIKESAERIHLAFARAVSDNIGVPYDAKLPIFRGQMFPAAEAVASGYIDQFGDLDDAARWVLAQSTIRDYNNQ